MFADVSAAKSLHPPMPRAHKTRERGASSRLKGGRSSAGCPRYRPEAAADPLAHLPHDGNAGTGPTGAAGHGRSRGRGASRAPPMQPLPRAWNPLRRDEARAGPQGSPAGSRAASPARAGSHAAFSAAGERAPGPRTPRLATQRRRRREGPAPRAGRRAARRPAAEGARRGPFLTCADQRRGARERPAVAGLRGGARGCRGLGGEGRGVRGPSVTHGH